MESLTKKGPHLRYRISYQQRVKVRIIYGSITEKGVITASVSHNVLGKFIKLHPSVTSAKYLVAKTLGYPKNVKRSNFLLAGHTVEPVEGGSGAETTVS